MTLEANIIKLKATKSHLVSENIFSWKNNPLLIIICADNWFKPLRSSNLTTNRSMILEQEKITQRPVAELKVIFVAVPTWHLYYTMDLVTDCLHVVAKHNHEKLWLNWSWCILIFNWKKGIYQEKLKKCKNFLWMRWIVVLKMSLLAPEGTLYLITPRDFHPIHPLL